MLDSTVVCRRALGCEWGGIRDGAYQVTDRVRTAVCTLHPFRMRIYRDMMLDSTVVCRRALGCEWGGGVLARTGDN